MLTCFFQEYQFAHPHSSFFHGGLRSMAATISSSSAGRPPMADQLHPDNAEELYEFCPAAGLGATQIVVFGRTVPRRPRRADDDFPPSYGQRTFRTTRNPAIALPSNQPYRRPAVLLLPAASARLFRSCSAIRGGF